MAMRDKSMPRSGLSCLSWLRSCRTVDWTINDATIASMSDCAQFPIIDSRLLFCRRRLELYH